jgi:hypothetical protein
VVIVLPSPGRSWNSGDPPVGLQVVDGPVFGAARISARARAGDVAAVKLMGCADGGVSDCEPASIAGLEGSVRS